MSVKAVTVEKIAAAIVAGMIIEAAHRGENVSAAEIAHTIQADPAGETASYFRRAAADALDWFAAFRADPDLLAVFQGGAA